MGKYDAVLPGLPKLVELPAYQERVDQVKQTLVEVRVVELAAFYVSLREKKREIEEELGALNLQITACEQLLAASQEAGAEGWGLYGVKDNAIRLPNGDTVRVQLEPSGKVVDKEAFRLWCLANGYERELQLWPSTMNALVKERLLAGEPEPDGCEAYSYTKIVYTRRKETE